MEKQDGYRKLIDELELGICTCWVHDNSRVEMNYMNDGYFGVVGSTMEKRTQYAGCS